MRSVTKRLVGMSAIVWLAVVVAGVAQERPDPRVGLKAGLFDAGEAAWNMERVSSMPRPDGFFDPELPAGLPSPPERTPEEAAAAAEAAKEAAAKAAASGAPPAPPRGGGLDFANSDLAFRGNQMVIGNFHGYTAYDIENTRSPRLIASVVCPGGQNDVSVHGNLLFMSVEATRGRVDCGGGGVAEPVSAERFRGIRIFDITDVARPRQIAAVQTCRGSHTHTLVTNPRDTTKVYVYNSGTGSPRSGEELEGCNEAGPEDPSSSLFSIDVIEVPLAAPETARIVSSPRIFADETGRVGGLWQGGDHGPGTQSSRMTNQCHDITVFPEVGLAAGACSGNGILLDIKDPVHPKRLDAVVDKSFAYWHSATFNNDGTKVVFTDEWGGGTRPRCRATDPKEWGANAIFDIVDGKLVFKSYFKLPAPQTEQENCVAHNGSIIPVPGRDLMVQAWYQGGLSVFDFTDSANPVEVAFFDRGPIDAEHLITGGYWSTYWYNGHIYGSEIARGMDIFRLVPSAHLTQNEIDAASQIRMTEFNAQEQPRITYPATSQVARAYLDQLRRANAVPAARAEAVNTALDRLDQLRTGQEANAAAVLKDVDTLAADMERAAASASGRDQLRLRALAENLAARTARLR
ncbi:MAG: hypothetical protein Q8L86_11390 [Vicinamibacterales bacterium]|nr:hypothetical protein [Vicinamibacterales bacterium]